MIVLEAVKKFKDDTMIRIVSFDHTETTGKAWLYNGNVAGLITPPTLTEQNIKENYGGYVVRKLEYNDDKKRFVIDID